VYFGLRDFSIMRLRIAAWIAVALTCIAAVDLGAQTLPPIPTTHPRILLVGTELARLQADNTANTAAAVRFRNMVNSAVGGANIYGYSAWYSALMGVVTGQPQYCTHAVTKAEAYVASEEALIASNQRPVLSYDSYLEVGDYVGDIMLVYDWCHANLSTSQKTRWRALASRALINVWDPDNATWNGNAFPWSGWSINNPVNNYHFSFLRATMLYGLATKHEAADADQWLNHFRFTKFANQLVPTYNSDLVGGGSREGSGYGTAMKGLFGLYWLWEKTTGERIADATPHSQATMAYMLHILAPTRDRIAPIGDHARDETAAFYDYHREMLLALSSIYSGTGIAQRVKSTLPLTNRAQMGDQFNWVWDYFYPGSTGSGGDGLSTTYVPAGTGHQSMRSGWETNATWLMFLAGPYTESHAHSDGLSLLLYKNGWLVNDANMQAHSGINQVQSAHGLVRQTLAGSDLPMYEHPASAAVRRRVTVKDEYTYMAADQGTLYNHPSTGNPGVRSEREIVFIKPNTVVVFDRVNYTAGTTTKIFQLPTAGLPTISGRMVTYSNGSSTLRVHAMSPASSALSITNMNSVDTDFNSGHRIDSSITNNALTRFLNVLSIDNTMVSVAAGANDSTAILQMDDGRQITIAFDPANIGGTIEIRNAQGVVTLSEALPTGINAPPLTAPLLNLRTAKMGNGVGAISSNPAGIDCGVDCSEAFAYDTQVTLTATPAMGSVFNGWRGGHCTGTGACVVRADDAKFVTAEFTSLAGPLNLIGVRSRATHGAESFDRMVDHLQPINGSPTVESRIGGVGHQVVFQFSANVGVAGTASVVNSNDQPAGSATPILMGNEVLVSLTGVTDGARVRVKLNGVDGSLNVSTPLVFLVGDADGSRSVNTADRDAIKARAGQLANSGNQQYDINRSGRITAADIAAAKARNGRTAP
jgi:hypothetical protein